MLDEDNTLFKINVLAEQVKHLFVLLQESDEELTKRTSAVLYIGIDYLNQIEKLSKI